MKSSTSFKALSGSNYFRLKIAYSLLLNQAIEITNIRDDDINPGLSKYEISFLKLISEITNGTVIDINKTGTTLKFTPGTITNNYGDEFTFQCDKSRAVTYYAEGLIPIAMFGKESLVVNLEGITNNNIDNSVDSFKGSTCALIQKLVVGDTVIFDIKKRGMFPNGCGCVKFKCPIITNLAPFDWVNEGKVKRVRGIAFTSKISSSFANRMVNKARGVLNNFLPDVWISTDSVKDKDLQKISPGYGISLVAETTNGFAFASDMVNKDNKDHTPEDLAKELSVKFLNDIYCAGAVDVNNQGLFLFLMALSEKNLVSEMKIGRITKYSKGVVRLIKQLLKVRFNIREVDEYDDNEEESEDDKKDEEEEEGEDKEGEDEEMENEDEEEEIGDGNDDDDEELPNVHEQYIYSCIGIGLRNVARIELS